MLNTYTKGRQTNGHSKLRPASATFHLAALYHQKGEIFRILGLNVFFCIFVWSVLNHTTSYCFVIMQSLRYIYTATIHCIVSQPVVSIVDAVNSNPKVKECLLLARYLFSYKIIRFWWNQVQCMNAKDDACCLRGCGVDRISKETSRSLLFRYTWNACSRCSCALCLL